MAKPGTLQGSLDLLILKFLSRRAPLHGYALMTGIVEISGDVLRVEEGSLYPALHPWRSPELTPPHCFLWVEICGC